jgi:CheY-like chemotaxis protein
MALRCLLVDDSRAFLEAASVLLEREGMTVVGVASSTAGADDADLIPEPRSRVPAEIGIVGARD